MKFVHTVECDVRASVGDYILAAAMIGVAVLALATRIDVRDIDAGRYRPDTWWGWAVTISVCAVLVGRRRWPLRTLAVVLALLLPLEFGHQRDTVAFFVMVITLYSVAAYLPKRLAWRGLALVSVFYGVLFVNATSPLSSVPILGPVFLAAAFGLGVMIQRTRTWQSRAIDVATEQAGAAIEEVELQGADERLRMAQELHDILAHSLSVIAVQAGIGVHLIDRDPVEASRALDAIRLTCDTTDSELTRLVAILRHDDATVPASAQTIANVAVLAEQIRTADRTVTLYTEGDLTAIPDGASLAAYRIVQEALTNVVRHAGNRAAATVTIRVVDDSIEIVVDDDGRGVTVNETSNRSGGNGLVGMRERARLYGGDVRSGPRPGGGFRVRASLHVRDGTPTTLVPARHETDSTNDTAVTHRRPISTSTWDIALAALMAVVALIEIVAADPTATEPHFTPTHLWAISLRLGSSATLAFRRRYPMTAYATAWVLGLALTIGDYQVGVMIFVLWIGLYSIAAHATTRQLVVAVAGTCAGILIIAWSKPPDLTDAGAVWGSVFFAASAMAGYTVKRDRDRRANDLEQQQHSAAAHAQHTRLTLANERLRIADELSTVISQTIHAIAQHAETGSRLIATDTTAAREALQAISTISRDALDTLRRLLKHLRTAAEPVPYDPIIATRQLTDPPTVGATG